MYRMAIIAESLKHPEVLNQWSKYIVNQRAEKVEGDEEELWHIYELHLEEKEILSVA